ncbi:hypothetical protein BDV06DRAFT_225751 [Aspergillus oleicola]
MIPYDPWLIDYSTDLSFPLVSPCPNHLQRLLPPFVSNILGPCTWAASRLPFIHALIKGTIIHDFQHRIAPNEVTFAHPNAYTGMFQPPLDQDQGQGKDQRQFLKDTLWWARQYGHPDSFLSVISPEKHARMRCILRPRFTKHALRVQEPFIQKDVNPLIARLQDLAGEMESKSAQVNMAPWFNDTTFDIFGGSWIWQVV